MSIPGKTLLELGAVTTIEDTDRYYVVRGSGDFYISGASLKAVIGGGGTWGSITGTLSNQTDLQAALNAKANNYQGIPVWTYTEGAIGAGLFTAVDSGTIVSTTKITLWYGSEGDGLDGASINFLQLYIQQNCILFMMDPRGFGIMFVCTSVTDSAVSPGQAIDFNGAVTSIMPAGNPDWEGSYGVTFWPGVALAQATPTLSAVLTASGISPIGDGAKTISSSLGGEFNTASGITTGWTTAS